MKDKCPKCGTKAIVRLGIDHKFVEVYCEAECGWSEDATERLGRLSRQLSTAQAIIVKLPVDAEGNVIIPTRQKLWKDHYGHIVRTSDIFYNHVMRRWAVTLENRTGDRTAPTNAWADECYRSHDAAAEAAATQEANKQ